MHVRDRSRHLPPPTPESILEDAQDEKDFQVCAAYVRDHACGPAEGMYGPQSITWQLWREPLLLVAGVPAVLLQVTHPAIATGVGRLSDFRQDILGRARRTFQSLYQLVFGDLHEAQKASWRLHVLHRRVRGTIEDPGGPLDGQNYRANDQALLRWVGSTVAILGRQVYEKMVRPLSEAERNQWFQEFLVASAASGIRPDGLPPNADALDRWFEEQCNSPAFRVTPLTRDIGQALFNSAVTHGPLDEIMAAGLLPPRWREGFGLKWGKTEQRAFSATLKTLHLYHTVNPPKLRACVAWHQAQLRIAQAHGQRPSRMGRLLNAIDRRIDLPFSINPIAEDISHASPSG